MKFKHFLPNIIICLILFCCLNKSFQSDISVCFSSLNSLETTDQKSLPYQNLIVEKDLLIKFGHINFDLTKLNSELTDENDLVFTLTKFLNSPVTEKIETIDFQEKSNQILQKCQLQPSNSDNCLILPLKINEQDQYYMICSKDLQSVEKTQLLIKNLYEKQIQSVPIDQEKQSVKMNQEFDIFLLKNEGQKVIVQESNSLNIGKNSYEDQDTNSIISYGQIAKCQFKFNDIYIPQDLAQKIDPYCCFQVNDASKLKENIEICLPKKKGCAKQIRKIAYFGLQKCKQISQTRKENSQTQECADQSQQKDLQQLQNQKNQTFQNNETLSLDQDTDDLSSNNCDISNLIDEHQLGKWTSRAFIYPINKKLTNLDYNKQVVVQVHKGKVHLDSVPNPEDTQIQCEETKKPSNKSSYNLNQLSWSCQNDQRRHLCNVVQFNQKSQNQCEIKAIEEWKDNPEVSVTDFQNCRVLEFADGQENILICLCNQQQLKHFELSLKNQEKVNHSSDQKLESFLDVPQMKLDEQIHIDVTNENGKIYQGLVKVQNQGLLLEKSGQLLKYANVGGFYSDDEATKCQIKTEDFVQGVANPLEAFTNAIQNCSLQFKLSNKLYGLSIPPSENTKCHVQLELLASRIQNSCRDIQKKIWTTMKQMESADFDYSQFLKDEHHEGKFEGYILKSNLDMLLKTKDFKHLSLKKSFIKINQEKISFGKTDVSEDEVFSILSVKFSCAENKLLCSVEEFINEENLPAQEIETLQKLRRKIEEENCFILKFQNKIQQEFSTKLICVIDKQDKISSQQAIVNAYNKAVETANIKEIPDHIKENQVFQGLKFDGDSQNILETQFRLNKKGLINQNTHEMILNSNDLQEMFKIQCAFEFRQISLPPLLQQKNIDPHCCMAFLTKNSQNKNILCVQNNHCIGYSRMLMKKLRHQCLNDKNLIDQTEVDQGKVQKIQVQDLAKNINNTKTFENIFYQLISRHNSQGLFGQINFNHISINFTDEKNNLAYNFKTQELFLNCDKQFCTIDQFLQIKSRIKSQEIILEFTNNINNFLESKNQQKENCFIMEFEESNIHYFDSLIVCPKGDIITIQNELIQIFQESLKFEIENTQRIDSEVNQNVNKELVKINDHQNPMSMNSSSLDIMSRNFSDSIPEADDSFQNQLMIIKDNEFEIQQLVKVQNKKLVAQMNDFDIYLDFAHIDKGNDQCLIKSDIKNNQNLPNQYKFNQQCCFSVQYFKNERIFCILESQHIPCLKSKAMLLKSITHHCNEALIIQNEKLAHNNHSLSQSLAKDQLGKQFQHLHSNLSNAELLKNLDKSFNQYQETFSFGVNPLEYQTMDEIDQTSLEKIPQEAIKNLEFDYQNDSPNGMWKGWVLVSMISERSKRAKLTLCHLTLEKQYFELRLSKESSPFLKVSLAKMKFPCKDQEFICSILEYIQAYKKLNSQKAQIQLVSSLNKLLQSSEILYGIDRKLCSGIEFENGKIRSVESFLICTLNQESYIEFQKSIQVTQYLADINTNIDDVPLVSYLTEKFGIYTYMDNIKQQTLIDFGYEGIELSNKNISVEKRVVFQYNFVKREEKNNNFLIELNNQPLPESFAEVDSKCCINFKYILNYQIKNVLMCSAEKYHCYKQTLLIYKKFTTSCKQHFQQYNHNQNQKYQSHSDMQNMLINQNQVNILEYQKINYQGRASFYRFFLNSQQDLQEHIIEVSAEQIRFSEQNNEDQQNQISLLEIKTQDQINPCKLTNQKTCQIQDYLQTLSQYQQSLLQQFNTEIQQIQALVQKDSKPSLDQRCLVISKMQNQNVQDQEIYLICSPDQSQFSLLQNQIVNSKKIYQKYHHRDQFNFQIINVNFESTIVQVQATETALVNQQDQTPIIQYDEIGSDIKCQVDSLNEQNYLDLNSRIQNFTQNGNCCIQLIYKQQKIIICQKQELTQEQLQQFQLQQVKQCQMLNENLISVLQNGCKSQMFQLISYNKQQNVQIQKPDENNVKRDPNTEILGETVPEKNKNQNDFYNQELLQFEGKLFMLPLQDNSRQQMPPSGLKFIKIQNKTLEYYNSTNDFSDPQERFYIKNINLENGKILQDPQIYMQNLNSQSIELQQINEFLKEQGNLDQKFCRIIEFVPANAQEKMNIQLSSLESANQGVRMFCVLDQNSQEIELFEQAVIDNFETYIQFKDIPKLDSTKILTIHMKNIYGENNLQTYKVRIDGNQGVIDSTSNNLIMDINILRNQCDMCILSDQFLKQTFSNQPQVGNLQGLNQNNEQSQIANQQNEFARDCCFRVQYQSQSLMICSQSQNCKLEIKMIMKTLISSCYAKNNLPENQMKEFEHCDKSQDDSSNIQSISENQAVIEQAKQTHQKMIEILLQQQYKKEIEVQQLKKSPLIKITYNDSTTSVKDQETQKETINQSPQMKIIRQLTLNKVEILEDNTVAFCDQNKLTCSVYYTSELNSISFVIKQFQTQTIQITIVNLSNRKQIYKYNYNLDTRILTPLPAEQDEKILQSYFDEIKSQNEFLKKEFQQIQQLNEEVQKKIDNNQFVNMDIKQYLEEKENGSRLASNNMLTNPLNSTKDTNELKQPQSGTNSNSLLANNKLEQQNNQNNNNEYVIPLQNQTNPLDILNNQQNLSAILNTNQHCAQKSQQNSNSSENLNKNMINDKEKNLDANQMINQLNHNSLLDGNPLQKKNNLNQQQITLVMIGQIQQQQLNQSQQLSQQQSNQLNSIDTSLNLQQNKNCQSNSSQRIQQNHDQNSQNRIYLNFIQKSVKKSNQNNEKQ